MACKPEPEVAPKSHAGSRRPSASLITRSASTASIANASAIRQEVELEAPGIEPAGSFYSQKLWNPFGRWKHYVNPPRQTSVIDGHSLVSNRRKAARELTRNGIPLRRPLAPPLAAPAGRGGSGPASQKIVSEGEL